MSTGKAVKTIWFSNNNGDTLIQSTDKMRKEVITEPSVIDKEKKV